MMYDLMNDDMLKKMYELNGITHAFVWVNEEGDFTAYIGMEDYCGFDDGSFETEAEATEHLDNYHADLVRLPTRGW